MSELLITYAYINRFRNSNSSTAYFVATVAIELMFLHILTKKINFTFNNLSTNSIETKGFLAFVDYGYRVSFKYLHKSYGGRML